jgi:two-component system chemotaxis response regulator CheY
VFAKDTRFVIVDDTKTIRSLLKEMLHNIGFRSFTEASDGHQALQLMKERADTPQSSEFIICYWKMPGMTGIELLEIRNEDDRFKNIPFLMVTIESEREYLLKAVSMGVSDFIVKPFSESTVANKLRGIWDRLESNSDS